MKKNNKIIILAAILSVLGVGNMVAQELGYVGGCPAGCTVSEACNNSQGTCSSTCNCDTATA